MTFELKRLSAEALPRALEKAERYRLLNEPSEAESICRDVLDVEPDNQSALVTLLLALTEQFDSDASFAGDAHKTIEQIRDEYARAYFTGIVYERRAKAHLHHAPPGFGPRVYGWLREAMIWYEKAEAIRPTGNDDAVLRWNACARLLIRDQRLEQATEERAEPLLLE